MAPTTNSPAPGNTYTINYGPYVSPGIPGANQTWNLAALATDSSLAVQFVAPASTPSAAQFPTATVAEMSALVTQYYRVAADGIHFAGSDDGGQRRRRFVGVKKIVRVSLAEQRFERLL